MLQRTAWSVALGALAGCGGGSNATAPGGTTSLTDSTALSPTSTSPKTVSLAHPTAADLDSIRATPSTFLDVYAALGTDPASVVRTAFGAPFATLNDTGCAILFAAVTSSLMAPIGSTALAPITATLTELLASPYLACGHYCKLTLLLSTLEYPTVLPPEAPAGSPAKPTIHFLVWLDTAPIDVGYHSQLVVTNVLDSACLLLDPTYGIAMVLPNDAQFPSAALTPIENAASLLQTPTAAGDLVIFNSSNASQGPTLLSAMLGGEMGPAYIYHDSIYGSEGWDTAMAAVVPGVG